ncbi:MAG: hypothetical protein HQM15_01055 [Deltaproteobacteria bacterium]|nr:hypothetical protein [Deltaproteobacteria bacterium]
MKNSLVYGHNSKDQVEVKQMLEPILDLQFAEHETADEQPYYFAGQISGERFCIYLNYNDSDNYWNYPEHQQYKILLLINETTRAVPLQKMLAEKIPELVLLEVYEEC